VTQVYPNEFKMHVTKYHTTNISSFSRQNCAKITAFSLF